MGAHRRGSVVTRVAGTEEAAVDRRAVVWAIRLGFGSVPLLFLAGLGVIPALLALSLRGRAVADMRQRPESGMDWGMLQGAMVCAVVTLILASVSVIAAGLVLLIW